MTNLFPKIRICFAYTCYKCTIVLICVIVVFIVMIKILSYLIIFRDYTRPDLPSGSDNELGGASGGTGVPELSAALAGKSYWFASLFSNIISN